MFSLVYLGLGTRYATAYSPGPALPYTPPCSRRVPLVSNEPATFLFSFIFRGGIRQQRPPPARHHQRAGCCCCFLFPQLIEKKKKKKATIYLPEFDHWLTLTVNNTRRREKRERKEKEKLVALADWPQHSATPSELCVTGTT